MPAGEVTLFVWELTKIIFTSKIKILSVIFRISV